MWFILSALAGLLFTGESLFQRHFLRKQKDAWAFSFFYSLVGTLVSLPFMLAAPVVPTSVFPWLGALFVGLLIVGNNLFLFKAATTMEASLIGALFKLKFAWIFVLGIVLLGSAFEWSKLAGVVLTMGAGLIIMHRFRRPGSSSGIYLVLAATVLNALLIIVSKRLLDYFNPVSLTFFVSFLPALVLNFICMPRARSRIKSMFSADWKVVFGMCVIGAAANLILNVALSLNDATSVTIVSEVFLVLILAGEHLFLKEKEQLWVKLASIVLAVAGAIMIQL
ncbi:MAG TPA: DMT family transporter [Bacillota bacterium]|nr:DMT family transporter [Bacillota bacterium]